METKSYRYIVSKEGINPKFFLLALGLIFLIYPLVISIDKYMKLNASMLFYGVILFIVISIISVLFGIERKLFKLLKKSLFSKYIIILIVMGYLVSVGVIYYKSNQRVISLELQNSIKDDFKKIDFISTLQNALLLKNIVIVDIEDKIDIEDIRNIILKKYNHRDDLAFHFTLKDDKNRSYTIYTSKFFDEVISYLLLYILLALLVWSLDWTYRSSETKWGRTKELIGVLVIVFFMLGIGLTVISKTYWGIGIKNSKVRTVLSYQNYFHNTLSVKLEDNQYTIVVRAKDE